MYSEVIKEIKKMHLSNKKSTFKNEDAKILSKVKDKDIEIKLVYCSEAK